MSFLRHSATLRTEYCLWHSLLSGYFKNWPMICGGQPTIKCSILKRNMSLCDFTISYGWWSLVLLQHLKITFHPMASSSYLWQFPVCSLCDPPIPCLKALIPKPTNSSYHTACKNKIKNVIHTAKLLPSRTWQYRVKPIVPTGWKFWDCNEYTVHKYI